jgi:heavy metal sensor kinase
MTWSIRARLTAWYGLVLTLVLALAGAGGWAAMRESIREAVDAGLRHELDAIAAFVAERDALAPEELRAELDAAARRMLAGGLFQVFEPSGTLLYQSPGLSRHGVTTLAPPPATPRPPGARGADDSNRRGRGEGPTGRDRRWRRFGASEGVGIRTDAARDWPVRMASRPAGRHGRIVEVAGPLRYFDATLRRFSTLLLLAVPLLVLVATSAGYWMAGRALAPVQDITRDARALDPRQLSARLTMPVARDELHQLTGTLNEMLARIEQSVSRTRQFTADASHELRGPLALIQAAAEYALRRERPREELADALGTVLRETQRTSRLVESLLLLARTDAADAPTSMGPADAARVVQDVLAATAPLAREHDVHLEADAPDAPVSVSIDATLLHRVVFILVDNAIKYTPAGGHVHVTAVEEGEEVRVSVRDTGIGIAPDDQSHVFDRFWRADRARSRGVGGAGLGLSIAQELVSRAGGTITLTSQPGTGSTFEVRLPRAES